MMSPRMALLVSVIPLFCACNMPKRPPKLDQKAEAAAAKAKAEESVDAGISKEITQPRARKRPGGATQLTAGEPIWIQSGKSRVLEVPYNVTRVSIGDPEIAGVVVLGPRSVLINAKTLPQDMGTAAGAGGTRIQRSGVLSAKPFTPSPNIAETTVILWDSANRTDSHTVFVAQFLPEQVMLEVTVAEVNRTEMEERGVDFNSLGGALRAGYWFGGGGDPSPNITQFLPFVPGEGGDPAHLPLFPLSFQPGRPTFAFQSSDGKITALVTALQRERLAKILAQPKIMALSGQYAVFQVGGEIPIRIVTSFSADVEFKAFGTLVNFLPRVSEEGDIILTVTPEVSQPDFNSPVEGIPTFLTRRASTTAKLREGETLVLGGLTQTQRREEESGLPYLKDIPFLGNAFRQTSYIDMETELLVIITPHLVKGMAPGTELDLPTDRGPLTRDEVKTKPEPNKVSRPRIPAPGANKRATQP